MGARARTYSPTKKSKESSFWIFLGIWEKIEEVRALEKNPTDFAP